MYEAVSPSDPIRQGDLFVKVPRVDFSPQKLIALQGDDAIQTTWGDIVRNNNHAEIKIITAVRPVFAIVATQDCDAVRAPDITLCEILPFQDVERKSKNTTSAKSWQSILTQQARVNQKWFYLPPSATAGFSDKMAVDFQITMRVPRVDLEQLRHLRTARLDKIADEHFRERISEFFRRYPYDEWYPLNAEEFAAYEKDHPGTSPFPWQHQT